jgi:cytochrome P450
MTQDFELKMTRPAHVPPELFLDRALHDIVMEADDPFIGASRLHEGPDIVWMTNACRGDPGWVPTRHSIFQEILLDPRSFSSADNAQTNAMLGVEWKLNPIEIDPPSHGGYRKLLQPWFEPAAIGKLEPLIQGVCDELIDRFADSGGCDFVTDFGVYFPSYVFLAIMGLPREQLPQFLVWEKKFTRSPDPAVRAEGVREIVRYLEGVVATRQREPGADLISFIANAEIEGKRLSHGEIMGMCTVLYLGGLDTLLNSVGWHMRVIATDKSLQERLRATPGDIPRAVNELLRAFGITTTKRTVTRDMEFHGVHMKAGDYVALSTCLASRDPERWNDPHHIDIDRTGNHLTLASGIHHCLGAHLARKEIGIVLQSFLSRFDDIHIPDGTKEEWHAIGNFGLDHLPLTWTRNAVSESRKT